MNTVTLSTKYQLVIPREARDRLALEPGARLTVVEKGGIWIAHGVTVVWCVDPFERRIAVLRPGVAPELRAEDETASARPNPFGRRSGIGIAPSVIQNRNNVSGCGK